MSLFKIIDAVPDPANSRFVVGLVAASSAVTVWLAYRAGSDAVLVGLAAVVLSAAGAFAWSRSIAGRLHGAVAGIVNSALLVIPFVVTGALMGQTGAGAFPAALAFLLALVVHSTRDIEHLVQKHNEIDSASAGSSWTAKAADDTEFWTHPTLRVYGMNRRLAFVSLILFLFGVISLWPWLGKLYDGGYFWILILGVLAPILYFWGRLKQPRGENPVSALIRFNRLLPYISLILLIAFALG
jgi:hypothetical protein